MPMSFGQCSTPADVALLGSVFIHLCCLYRHLADRQAVRFCVVAAGFDQTRQDGHKFSPGAFFPAKSAFSHQFSTGLSQRRCVAREKIRHKPKKGLLTKFKHNGRSLTWQRCDLVCGITA